MVAPVFPISVALHYANDYKEFELASPQKSPQWYSLRHRERIVDLEEILALDNAHVRSKEAEVLAILTEFTGPARRQLDGIKRDLGHVLPEFLPGLIDPGSREVARHTVKVCTGSLFDVYADTAFTYVFDAEPFIALLPMVSERVRLKLGIIDKDEAEVRRHKWESAAWAREKPTLRRRLFKWLMAFLDEPAPAVESGSLSGAQAGVQDSSRLAELNSDESGTGAIEVSPGERATVGDPGHGSERSGESSHPRVPETLDAPRVEPPAAGIGGQEVDRSEMVDDFLLRCNQEPGLPEKLLRKHIWAAAMHTSARQFQYWQKRDAAATAEDNKNFGRILAMQPGEFVALLKRMNLISNKS